MTVSENKANRFEQLPDVDQVLPEQCLNCGCDSGYAPAATRGIVEFRNEKFEIEYERMECPECGDAMLSDEQATERIKKTVTAYQEQHNLLTAKEISSRRKDLGYSQRALVALAPDISIATLKRIEGGLSAQNKSTDLLIRVTLESLESKERLERIWAISKEEPTTTVVEHYVIDHSRPLYGTRSITDFGCGGITFGGFSTRIFSTVRGSARVDIGPTDLCESPPQDQCYRTSLSAGEEQFAMAV